MRLLSLPLALLLLLFAPACDNADVNEGGGPDPINFDRRAMLTVWADEVYAPALDDLLENLRNLIQALDRFDPAATEIIDQIANIDVQTYHEQSYRSWQKLAPFSAVIGEQFRLRERLNTYPTDTERVDLIARGEGVNFLLPSNHDVQGFPALDYLVNTPSPFSGDRPPIFRSEADFGPEYLELAKQLASEMYFLTLEVKENWQPLKDAYIQNDGNSATASIDRTVNDYIFYVEKFLRAGKVGIPAGVFSDDPLPNKVESRFNPDRSGILFLDALAGCDDFFAERGLADYLEAVTAGQPQEPLSDLILAQFDAIEGEARELRNFQNLVETDNEQMLQLYDELQKLVVLLKVDMLQALSINVDYVDADGD